MWFKNHLSKLNVILTCVLSCTTNCPFVHLTTTSMYKYFLYLIFISVHPDFIIILSFDWISHFLPTAGGWLRLQPSGRWPLVTSGWTGECVDLCQSQELQAVTLSCHLCNSSPAAVWGLTALLKSTLRWVEDQTWLFLILFILIIHVKFMFLFASFPRSCCSFGTSWTCQELLLSLWPLDMSRSVQRAWPSGREPLSAAGHVSICWFLSPALGHASVTSAAQMTGTTLWGQRHLRSETSKLYLILGSRRGWSKSLLQLFCNSSLIQP